MKKLIDRQRWLQWADMVPRCHSVAIDAAIARLFNLYLSINNQQIPSLGQKRVRFLGFPINTPNNIPEIKRELALLLEKKLKTINDTPVAR